MRTTIYGGREYFVTFTKDVTSKIIKKVRERTSSMHAHALTFWLGTVEEGKAIRFKVVNASPTATV